MPLLPKTTLEAMQAHSKIKYEGKRKPYRATWLVPEKKVEVPKPSRKKKQKPQGKIDWEKVRLAAKRA